MDFKTIPTAKVWAGMIIFMGANFTAAMDAANNFIDNTPTDAKATVQVLFPAATTVGVNIFYDGPGDNSPDGSAPPALFDAFTQLPANNNGLAYTTLSTLATASVKSVPNGLR